MKKNISGAPSEKGGLLYQRTALAENMNFCMFPLAVTICLNSMMVTLPPVLPPEEPCFAHAETVPLADRVESDSYGVRSVVPGGV